jgi:very-short-patch-repair endonuclease
MPHEIVPETRRNNAKRMRKGMTDAERRLWNQLRAHRLMNLGFRRQMPIGSFIADFACPDARIVVEVDGSQHAMPAKAIRDQVRTRQLEETGWLVIRFWNDEVMHELNDVCEHIVRIAMQNGKHTPLSPAVTTPPQRMITEQPLSGGCQCGAVRYRVSGPLTFAHICHCRMCQKASGNYFMALANVQLPDFTVTRGEISWFHSSAPVRRGFCRDCGTPLIFQTLSMAHLNITLGSLDDPAPVQPELAVGLEGKMPWFACLEALPGAESKDDPGDDGVRLADVAASNRQHPDHDTDTWPPEDRL